MQIVFDARYVRPPVRDGISRYSVELGRALSKLVPTTFMVGDESQTELFPDAEGFIKGPPVESISGPFPMRLLRKAGGADVFYTPLQLAGGRKGRAKVVVTIHDMIYYHRAAAPSSLRFRTRIAWALFHLSRTPARWFMRNADLVVTPSDYVRREVTEAKLTRERIVVIPGAPSLLAGKAIQGDSPPRNLVYIGAYERYKNTETLIQAMRFLPGRNLHLVSALSESRRRTLQSLIPPGANVIFHGGLSDRECSDLLLDDALLVSATTDEGFGLPAVEALSIGVPCVLSDIPALREVAGGGAAYFDSASPESCARAVARLDDRNSREEAAATGRHHIAKYNWQSSASQLAHEIMSLSRSGSSPR